MIAGRAERVVVRLLQLAFTAHQGLIRSLHCSIPRLADDRVVRGLAPVRPDRIDAPAVAPMLGRYRSLVGTLVHIDARLPVLVQHVPLRADAERTPERIEAGVRAAAIVDRTFVDVLAGVAVGR